MPIVLAIEPDRRQAAHLTAIVRHQVGAELLLADTTEGALDAIGDRIPDLVLVPALLSPQDDAALAAALRVIAAAAHVRTLTIPVLANGTKRAAGIGMLAKWRKKSAASPEPEGCDPAVFGEQISTYLREAAAERAQIEDDLMHDEPVSIAPLMTAQTRPEEAAVAIEEAWAEPIESIAPVEAIRQIEALQEVEPIEEVESIAEMGASEEVEPIEEVEAMAIEPAAEPLQLWAGSLTDTPAGEEAIELDEPLIDLSGQLEDLSDEIDGELFDGEPVGVYTISAGADEPTVDTLDRLPSILEPDATPEAVVAAMSAAAPVRKFETEPLFAEPLVAEPLADPLFDEPLFPTPMLVESVFVEPPEPPRQDIQPWVPMYLTPGRMWPTLEGMPAEMPAPRSEQPDWIELVASLRQDLERRRTDPAAAAVDPIAARPSDGAEAQVHQLVKKPRPHTATKKAKPVQDEWGFFDPEQCGFSTLLAKLEEITEDPRA